MPPTQVQTESYWVALESKTDRPEVQEQIRRAILRGLIRVVPKPGGGVRIIPCDRAWAERHDFPTP